MIWDSLTSMRPPGGFALAMIDPPWRFKAFSAKGVTAKSAGGQYRTMDLGDIGDMPLREIMAPDSWIWLWATNPMLPHALDVLASWGARFATAGHWSKRTARGGQAFGTGHVLRCAGEPFLIGCYGRPKVVARNIRSVIEGPLREHSRKPDEAFSEAARMVPHGAPKIEIFSRESRPGWHVWGDESGKFQTGQDA